MIFTQRYERTVDRDNTVRFNNRHILGMLFVNSCTWVASPV